MVDLSKLRRNYNLFILLFLFDGIFTYIGLSTGIIYELNPFVNYAINIYGVFISTILLKSLFSIFLYILGYIMFDSIDKNSNYELNTSFKLFKFLLSVVLIFYIVLIIYEIILLLWILL
ncbi:hypothetical protein GQ473_07140 [archaeon]|nr:hypothetical protein [archaeon]